MNTARAAALAVMLRVRRGAFAAPALNSELEPIMDARDRALATDLVYSALRHERRLEAALAERLKQPDRLPEAVNAALLLGAAELLVREAPRHAAVNEWVNIVKQRHARLGGLANAVLRRVELPGTPSPAVAASLPDWLFDEFRASLGEHAPAAAAGMLAPEPLWLTTLSDEAAPTLESEGCEVGPGPVPGSLRVRTPVPLGELETFTSGLIQPQNPSSLHVTRVVGAGPGDTVLDLASGNGIKAAIMANDGAKVTSVELSAAKLKRAERNQRRLGVRVKHVEADLSTLPDGLAPAGKVLLDAPCTGTGTLRGNPEIKRRLEPEDVQQAVVLQAQMLATAAQLTAPGGELTYAVCSLTRAEGPDQAASFLEANPGFAAIQVDSDGLPFLQQEHGGFILPLDGLDGFYVARFRRLQKDV